MNFQRVLRDSIAAQFGNELAAGLHAEYPRLRQMWLEAAAERAEQDALVDACWQVSMGSADPSKEN